MVSTKPTAAEMEKLLLSSDEEKRAQFPKSSDPQKDDVWVPGICNMCYNSCPIRVHRVNGVVVKIEGNPTTPNQGKICPRGNAGIMRMYDPNRIKTPLKRTNPKKGIGVDPGWVEVSWEEAFSTITQKLKEVRERDPRKLIIGSMDTARRAPIKIWSLAYGCPITNGAGGTPGGVHCGNGTHMFGEMVHGSFVEWVDADLNKMLILIGCSAGHETYPGLGTDARRFAEARLKGMKLVVVDPRMSAAAAKASEWVPIRPGTDSALALGMIHVLINELGVYDAHFIKQQTNGPYLIGPDGYYTRDQATGKPLVWDGREGRAKPFDDLSIQDFSLEGSYQVGGAQCKPAFQVLKEHVARYNPERVEEISSVPPDTVRRLARDWGEAASIGATITIEGKEYPYRPVSIMSYRGNQAHKRATLEAMALLLLPMIVGALDMPGGQLRMDLMSASTMAFPINRMLAPGIMEGEDGIVETHTHLWSMSLPVEFPPQLHDLKAYFPLSLQEGQVCYFTAAEPERYGFKKGDHVFWFHHTNPMMSMGGPRVIEKALQNSFVIDCNIVIDETAEMADIIVPESTYLERYHVNGSWVAKFAGLQAAFPAVEEPLYGCKDFLEILMEVGDRLDIVRGEQGVNWWYNAVCSLQEPFQLNLDRRYTYAEILDHVLQSHNGDARYNLEWFRQHGHRIRHATPEEIYQPYGQARLPLYSELMKRTGDKLRQDMEKKKIQEQINLKWEFSDYQALPDWKPGPVHTAPAEYDLFAINYKPVMLTFSNGAFNPYLMEIAEKDPYVLKLWMNSAAAKKRGLKEGDRVWIQSPVHRMQGVVTVSESIHPECVGIASTLGHWVNHSIAKGKGMHFNALNPLNWEWTDFVSGAVEGVTSRVKVYKST